MSQVGTLFAGVMTTYSRAYSLFFGALWQKASLFLILRFCAHGMPAIDTPLEPRPVPLKQLFC